MRAHCLQHVPFEGLGSIEAWLRKEGHEVSCTRFFEGDRLPSPEDLDFLIVMGGPMGVHDEAAHPWLAEEKAFIDRVIEAGSPVLGICLGAQLIAASLGARVFPCPEKEIGWFPVQGIETGDPAAFRFPSEIPVFHWHGDTFELPPGAIRLARSEACPNQAFQLGRRVIGLQFHLETTPESAQAIVRNASGDIVEGRYIQPGPAILSAPPEYYSAINQLMEEVLAHLIRQAKK